MSHIDPVCRMEIEDEDSVGTHVHNGVTYYFCNPGCADKFAQNPAAYLG